MLAGASGATGNTQSRTQSFPDGLRGCNEVPTWQPPRALSLCYIPTWTPRALSWALEMFVMALDVRGTGVWARRVKSNVTA